MPHLEDSKRQSFHYPYQLDIISFLVEHVHVLRKELICCHSYFLIVGLLLNSNMVRFSHAPFLNFHHEVINLILHLLSFYYKEDRILDAFYRHDLSMVVGCHKITSTVYIVHFHIYERFLICSNLIFNHNVFRSISNERQPWF